MKTRLILFMILTSTFLLFAENFWMKLNWDLRASSIFLTDDGEIFINSERTNYKSIDEGNSWNETNYNFSRSSIMYYDRDFNFMYLYGNSNYLSRIHKDSTEVDTLLQLYFTGIEKYNDDFYITKPGSIIKTYDFKDTTTVLTADDWQWCLAKGIDGTLFAGSTDYFGECGLFKSYDDGDTWEGIELMYHYIRAIEVDSEGRIFLGTMGHYYDFTGIIFRSEDYGTTWDMLVGNSAYTLSMAINTDDEIFIGLDDETPPYGGVLFSEDHGVTWSYLGEEITGGLDIGGCGAVNDIKISKDGYVFIATDAGVYRSINSTTGIENSDELLVMSYELEQNYPNPFNNQTSISLSIPKSCEVKLGVYNIKGEFVKDIFNGLLIKGTYNYTFEANDINSGVYFYNIEINGKIIDSKKMLYLK
jgi:hypothetical protein